MGGAPGNIEVGYGPSSYRAQCALPLTALSDAEPSDSLRSRSWNLSAGLQSH